MIIDLRTIPKDGPKHFELCLEKGWWNPDNQDDQIIDICTPIKAQIDIYKAGSKYVLEGNMCGSVSIRCDRCLMPYENEIKTDFKLFFTQSSQHGNKVEIELLEDDLETGFINGEEMEMDDIFREQIYLSLPIKSLCKEGCKGLCPICGTDLNVQSCNCGKERH